MKPRHRLVIKDSTWIVGEAWTTTLKHAISESGILRRRGARMFTLKKNATAADLEELRRLIVKDDSHFILSWLLPKELAAIFPLMKDRKNFSIFADDWWMMPYWYMREADYIFFRKYHGIAVRKGLLDFVNAQGPPWLFDPRPQLSRTATIYTALRPVALALTPFAEVWNWWRRRDEEIPAHKLVYLPFSVDAADVPPGAEEVKYDFVNTAGTIGVWLMRDPYAPFRYSFANLYHDRKRLVDSIMTHDKNPFACYDCRREKFYFLPYDEYIRKTRQGRYVMVTGGLHDAALPKYLEYATMGTPMIGRGVPFEHPWVEKILFPIDIMNLTPAQVKPLLQEAVDRYPTFKENSLNIRDWVLKQYNFNTLLDLAQAQADGQPIPEDYVKLPPASRP